MTGQLAKQATHVVESRHGKLAIAQLFFAFGVVAVAFAGLAAFMPPLPARLGTIDFRPYWSSSYLLARSEDFSDSTQMDAAERTLTAWTEPYTMVAWFAPTGQLILLPFTYLPFARAASLWLLANIVSLFLSLNMLWSRYGKHRWAPLVATFGFSATLVALVFGQVNTLEILGIALFLSLSERRSDFLAGASLILTTVKPHLVILTLPLLLLDMLRRRRWSQLAGFGVALAVCALALFIFYPAWPVSFWRIVTSGLSSARETPTLAGLLVVAGQLSVAKWLWIPALVGAIAVWWRRGRDWDVQTLVDVSIIAGLMIAPIGWSYDQVILLIPLLHVIAWAVRGYLGGKAAFTVVAVLLVTDALTYYERVLSPNEVWFFWVPLVAAGVYIFALRCRQTTQAVG